INNQRYVSLAIFDKYGSFNNKIKPGIGYIPTVTGGYLQPDKKLMIYGDILSVNGKARNGAAKINENGSLDNFNFQLGNDDKISKIIDLPDGGFVLCGDFPSMGLNRKLIKTDMDGNPDYSFNVDVFGTIEDFMIMPESDNDYSILIAGNFQNINYFYINNLAKISPDGKLVKSFNANDIIHSPVKQIDTLANGNIILAGYMLDPVKGYLLQTPQNADTVTFDLKPFEEVLESILYISNDTILVGGFNSNSPSRVYHIDYKGNILNNSAIQINSMDGVFHDLLVLPDQSVLIGGRFTQLNSFNQQGLVRSELNGQIWNDYSLNLNGERSYVSNFVRADDNHIYVMGYFEGINNVTRTSLAKLRIEHIFPSVEGLKTQFSIKEDSSFKLTIDSLKINLGYVPLEEIVMNLLEGNNYTIVNDTIIPDQNFYGTLNIGVQLHDGYDLSEKSSISLEVLPINDPPIIMHQKNIPSLRADEEVTINLNTLEIEDPDSENFNINILQGDYYRVNNLSTFIIDEDYLGEMVLNIQVSDGDTLSNVFEYKIIVEEPLSLFVQNEHINFFYPNPASKFININPLFFSSNFQIQIMDFQGKVLIDKSYQLNSNYQVNLEMLSPGIYFIKYIYSGDFLIGKLAIKK
ncbi:MAG: T9SS type A sorting domain-containing protein, partial [Cyclobacteriaceae bacterium]